MATREGQSTHPLNIDKALRADFLGKPDIAMRQRIALLLVAAACAHHRLVWVHPFLDGNGRASWLQLHATLRRLTGGLWSVNRGLARKPDDYFIRLSETDMAQSGRPKLGVPKRGHIAAAPRAGSRPGISRRLFANLYPEAATALRDEGP